MATCRQMAQGRSTLLLQRQSMPCCSNGTMTRTEEMEFFLTIRRYKAPRCCHECPKGKVHSWQAQAFSRTSRKKPTGCPCCAGHQLCECNSLETVCPDIAADFDAEENGITAAELTSSTTTKYSWLSDKPGAKKRSVHQRTSYTRRKFFTDARRL